MFDDCNNLAALDLGNFNTSKVTDKNYMFKDCGSDLATLTAVYVKDEAAQ